MTTVPYMAVVGNHESECHSLACQFSSFKKNHLGNYTAYNARFKMPSAEVNGVQNMWYSFEHGPIHFTTISSETDYVGAPSNAYTASNKNGNFGNQLAWLEKDLQKAAANRANVPWIIIGMHRPLYVLTNTDANGQPTADSLTLQRAFVELFIKYQVDVVLAGHEHAYERHLPIARGAGVKGGVSSDFKTYADPKAPVYIVTGAAGNSEGHSVPKNSAPVSWNVLENHADYGISTLTASRKSLHWKFIASDSQKVLDDFVITKS